MGILVIHADDNVKGHTLKETCRCNPQVFSYSDIETGREVHVKVLKTLRVITEEEHMLWIIGGGVLLLLLGLAILIMTKKKKEEPVVIPSIPPVEPSIEPPIDPPGPGLIIPPDWEDAAYLFHFKDMKPPIADSEYATNPLKHWYDWGKAAGWKWKPDGWSSAQYLINNPDVAASPKYGSAPLLHYWEWGQTEGRSYLTILPEIANFVRLPECDNLLSCYFGINKINGKMVFGTYGYQHGDHSSEIYEYPHTRVADFDCESVMQIEKHDGKFYCIVEHGKFKQGVDRGMIYRLDGNVWNEVYRNGEKVLGIGLKSHTDGYIYATFPGAGFSSTGTEVMRSKSGDPGTWELWYDNRNEYSMFFMDSWGPNLVLAAASSNMDWGGSGHPSVFVNKDMVWRDYSRQGSGFWGVVAFNNDVYLGGTGPARVARLSDKKTVWERPGFEAIHCMIIDKMRNTLYVFPTKEAQSNASGSEIWATKDGNNWYNLGGPINCTGFINAYYDVETAEIWLAGGRFAQGSTSDLGYGRIFKSVRV